MKYTKSIKLLAAVAFCITPSTLFASEEITPDGDTTKDVTLSGSTKRATKITFVNETLRNPLSVPLSLIAKASTKASISSSSMAIGVKIDVTQNPDLLKKEKRRRLLPLKRGYTGQLMGATGGFDEEMLKNPRLTSLEPSNVSMAQELYTMIFGPLSDDSTPPFEVVDGSRLQDATTASTDIVVDGIEDLETSIISSEDTPANRLRLLAYCRERSDIQRKNSEWFSALKPEAVTPKDIRLECSEFSKVMHVPCMRKFQAVRDQQPKLFDRLKGVVRYYYKNTSAERLHGIHEYLSNEESDLSILAQLPNFTEFCTFISNQNETIYGGIEGLSDVNCFFYALSSEKNPYLNK